MRWAVGSMRLVTQRSTSHVRLECTNVEGLAQVVSEIDALERSEITEIRYLQYSAHYAGFIGAALALIGLSALAGSTLLRRLP